MAGEAPVQSRQGGGKLRRLWREGIQLGLLSLGVRLGDLSGVPGNG